LRAARLVEATREGSFVVCRLADPKVSALLASLRDLAEARLLEIDEAMQTFLGDHKDLELVASRELLARVRKGEVVLLDVRPEPEFQAGHLPRARSVPLGELERRLQELPRDREIVAYCRGPYCLLAVRAVELLRGRGWRACRLRDGVPEWSAAGLPIEATKRRSTSAARRS
jgi:rhodanese-related sulfurtransferase